MRLASKFTTLLPLILVAISINGCHSNSNTPAKPGITLSTDTLTLVNGETYSQTGTNTIIVTNTKSTNQDISLDTSTLPADITVTPADGCQNVDNNEKCYFAFTFNYKTATQPTYTLKFSGSDKSATVDATLNLTAGSVSLDSSTYPAYKSISITSILGQNSFEFDLSNLLSPNDDKDSEIVDNTTASNIKYPNVSSDRCDLTATTFESRTVYTTQLDQGKTCKVWIRNKPTNTYVHVDGPQTASLDVSSKTAFADVDDPSYTVTTTNSLYASTTCEGDKEQDCLQKNAGLYYINRVNADETQWTAITGFNGYTEVNDVTVDPAGIIYAATYNPTEKENKIFKIVPALTYTSSALSDPASPLAFASDSGSIKDLATSSDGTLYAVGNITDNAAKTQYVVLSHTPYGTNEAWTNIKGLTSTGDEFFTSTRNTVAVAKDGTVFVAGNSATPAIYKNGAWTMLPAAENISEYQVSMTDSANNFYTSGEKTGANTQENIFAYSAENNYPKVISQDSGIPYQDYRDMLFANDKLYVTGYAPSTQKFIAVSNPLPESMNWAYAMNTTVPTNSIFAGIAVDSKSNIYAAANVSSPNDTCYVLTNDGKTAWGFGSNPEICQTNGSRITKITIGQQLTITAQ